MCSETGTYCCVRRCRKGLPMANASTRPLATLSTLSTHQSLTRRLDLELTSARRMHANLARAPRLAKPNLLRHNYHPTTPFVEFLSIQSLLAIRSNLPAMSVKRAAAADPDTQHRHLPPAHVKRVTAPKLLPHIQMRSPLRDAAVPNSRALQIRMVPLAADVEAHSPSATPAIRRTSLLRCSKRKRGVLTALHI